MKERRLTFGGVGMLFLPTVFIYIFSTSPSYEFFKPDESQLLLSLKKRTEKVKVCDEAEQEAFQAAQANVLKHMRTQHVQCGSRERVPLTVKIAMDGKEYVSKSIEPAGLRSDSVVFVFEKFTFKSGPHDILITMKDAKEGPEIKTYEFREHIDFQPRRVVLVTYTPESDALHIHK
ncbi:MAG: hypothetical protein OEV92_04940 [Nitrospinota bacterium]|nr:hypothetical protein [Nitrospinota bacterium]